MAERIRLQVPGKEGTQGTFYSSNQAKLHKEELAVEEGRNKGLDAALEIT